MQNLSLTDSMSNSDTDTCRSMGMLPRAKQPTPNGIPGPHYNPRQDFDSEFSAKSQIFLKKSWCSLSIFKNSFIIVSQSIKCFKIFQWLRVRR